MEKRPSRKDLIQRVARLEAQLRHNRNHSPADDCVETFGLADMMQAADGICVCHATDQFPFVRFTFWNHQMTRLTGYDMETINRQGWYQSVYPDTNVQARAIERMTQMRQGVNLEAENWEITRADGDTRILRISTSVLDQGDGTPQVMAIMHDVTELKHLEATLRSDKQNLKREVDRQSKLLADAQEALQVSDARYRALFNIAGDALFVENERDEILDVNQQACDLLGYSREELLTMKVCDIQAPECRGESGRILTGEVAQYHGKPFETVDLHKDGTRIPVEVTNNRLEEAGLFLSIVRDIRERKLADEARRETFEIIEKSPATVFLWRNETDWPVEFVTRNVSRIFGHSAEDFLTGRVAYSKVVHPDDLDRVAGEVQENSSVPDRMEFTHEPYRIVAKDGETHWVKDSTSIRRDASGNVTHYQGIVEDITDRIRAEAALRQSEDEKRTILDSLKELVIYHDTHMRIVWANKAACESIGVTLEDLIGRPCHTFWGDSSTPCPDCVVVPAMASGRSQQAEVQTPDGRIWFNQGHPVFDENGVVSGGIETCLEITERKQAELALQESEARLRQVAATVRERNEQLMTINEELEAEIEERQKAEQRQSAILENIPDIAWLKDRDSRFIAVNDQLAKASGWNAADLVGKNDLDVWPRELAEHYRADDAEVMQTGERKTIEEPISDAYGQIRWFETIKTPIIDPDGNVMGTAGIARDITKRKQMEQDLLTERERLAVTLRSIGDAVITTDREGGIALMNPIAEQLTGWTEAEAIGRPLMEVFRIVDERTGVPCANPVDKVLASGQIVALANHTALIAKDGQKSVIADSGAPILNARNEIIGVVLVFRDITGQQHIEKELLKMEKLKSLGVLAGGIAHDFNNFLTGIIGNLSLAKLDVQPGHPLGRPLEEMERAALRAKELTQQLLTFSKGGEPVKHTTRIDDLVRECARFSLHGSNVGCDIDIESDLHPADVDEGQIAQVLNNLMINADQAMPQGGIIHIRVTNVYLAANNPFALDAGDYIQLIVRDEGMGIQPEHLKKVFDPYFTTKQKGSGLGLAVAYSIIAKHDGQLTVESELGRGTTFTIVLPSSKDTHPSDTNTTKAFVAGHGRVLVMDDEDFIRELASDMLEKMGYEVVTAQDGQSAVDMYESSQNAGNPFNAVILDLTVPGGMGGREALRKLMDQDPGVRAIVSSGYSNDPVMANYAAHGFKGAVKKPYLVQEMSRVLYDVINGH